MSATHPGQVVSEVTLLADHERRLQRLERPKVDAARVGADSDGRAALRVYDASGVLRISVGEQDDGTYTARIWDGSGSLLWDALVP